MKRLALKLFVAGTLAGAPVCTLTLMVGWQFLPPWAGFLGALLAIGLWTGSAILLAGLKELHRQRQAIPVQPAPKSLNHIPYLPRPTELKRPTGREVFRNGFYRVHADNSGDVQIADRRGALIVRSLIYYSAGSRGMAAKLDGLTARARGNELVITGRGPIEDVSVTLRFAANSPQIKVSTRVAYRGDAEVERSACVLDFAVPPTEVYTRDGRRITENFRDEYWLERQGARFGNGTTAALVCHVPGVSSLQLDTGNQRLWVNLDYSLDHPYLKIPYRQDGTAKYADWSAAKMKAGQVRENEFALVVGHAPPVTARLSPHRAGATATYIWTEHACHAAFPPHLAVYFGSSELSKPSAATGGFVKHRIPVTKTVHFANSQAVANAGQSKLFPGPMLAIDNEPGFLGFLDSLHSLGIYDIGLHCPQPTNSDRAFAEHAIRFMKERFNTATWIDHIWLKPTGDVAGCRESFSAEGATSGEIGYFGDLWSKYGTRYFWNNSHEYLGPVSLRQPTVPPAPVPAAPAPLPAMTTTESLKANLKQLRLRVLATAIWARLIPPAASPAPPTSAASAVAAAAPIGPLFHDHLLRGREMGLPMPNYWQHPTVTADFYSWPTYQCELGSRSPAEWDAMYSDLALQRFVADGEIYINHCYPVWVGEANGCWTTDAAGACVITPEFDAVLRRMAELRDQGELDLCTIPQAIEHWRSLENVDVEYTADGNLVLRNRGGQIRGLTLCVDEEIAIAGVLVSSRNTRNGRIVWFDLRAHATVVLRRAAGAASIAAA